MTDKLREAFEEWYREWTKGAKPYYRDGEYFYDNDKNLFSCWQACAEYMSKDTNSPVCKQAEGECIQTLLDSLNLMKQTEPEDPANSLQGYGPSWWNSAIDKCIAKVSQHWPNKVAVVGPLNDAELVQLAALLQLMKGEAVEEFKRKHFKQYEMVQKIIARAQTTERQQSEVASDADFWKQIAADLDLAHSWASIEDIGKEFEAIWDKHGKQIIAKLTSHPTSQVAVVTPLSKEEAERFCEITIRKYQDGTYGYSHSGLLPFENVFACLKQQGWEPKHPTPQWQKLDYLCTDNNGLKIYREITTKTEDEIQLKRTMPVDWKCEKCGSTAMWSPSDAECPTCTKTEEK